MTDLDQTLNCKVAAFEEEDKTNIGQSEDQLEEDLSVKLTRVRRPAHPKRQAKQVKLILACSPGRLRLSR